MHTHTRNPFHPHELLPLPLPATPAASAQCSPKRIALTLEPLRSTVGALGNEGYCVSTYAVVWGKGRGAPFLEDEMMTFRGGTHADVRKRSQRAIDRARRLKIAHPARRRGGKLGDSHDSAAARVVATELARR